MNRKIRRIRDLFFDNWAFFGRGYGAYVTFAVSLYNFINILILRGFEQLMVPSTVLIVVAGIGVVCNIIGRLDFRYGLAPRSGRITSKSSPYNRDLAKAIIYLARHENEKAIEIMEKWTEPISVK